MNVLPGSLLAEQADLTAGIPAGYELAKLAFGVRPESVRLAEKGLPARVIAAEYLGADTQVETRGTRVLLDVWCRNQAEELTTVGSAGALVNSGHLCSVRSSA